MAQIPAGFERWIPISMAGSLIIGASLALGHDQFYLRLNGTVVPPDNYQIGEYLATAKQQFNLNVGNALATLTKMCLMLAISPAIFQAFWRSATNRQWPDIPKLDSVYAAPRHLLSFLHVNLWTSAPLVFILALTAWVVPLLTIFTPGTLSINVQPQVPPTVENIIVPNLDFRSLVFTQDMVQNDTGTYLYRGPSQRVLKVAEAVAKGNAILSVSPPASNSTWRVEFRGPSIRCADIVGDDREMIFTNIAEWTKSHCKQPSGYLSWLQKRPGDQVELPYVLEPPKQAGFDAGASSLYDNDANVALYIATAPTLLQFRTPSDVDAACSNSTSQNPVSSPEASFGDTSLIRCNLVNATYNVAFEFVEGVQYLNRSVAQDSDADVIKAVTSVAQDIRSGSVCMQIGSVGLNPGECIFDDSLLHRISYQSVFVAFDSIVKGRVTLNEDVSVDTITGVSLTALADTKELAYLTNLTSAHNGLTLQRALAMANTTESHGLSHELAEQQVFGSRPLAEAMPDLFHNITISLLSSSELCPNVSSITAPNKVSVTFTSWQPTYKYARGRLWLFNGIAIGLATLAVVVGLSIIFKHNVAYEDTLSTVLGLCPRSHGDPDTPILDAEQEAALLQHADGAQVPFNGVVQDNEESGQDRGSEYELDDISIEGRRMRPGV